METLQVRAGPCLYGSIDKPPHIYTTQDAYDIGLLVLAEEEAHAPHAAHLEDSGLSTPEGFAMVNRARRKRFVMREAMRVAAWAENIRKDIVLEATIITNLTPTLKEIWWYPYEAGDVDDGEYMVRVAFNRCRWGFTSISGGVGHTDSSDCSLSNFDMPWAFEQG